VNSCIFISIFQTDSIPFARFLPRTQPSTLPQKSLNKHNQPQKTQTNPQKTTLKSQTKPKTQNLKPKTTTKNTKATCFQFT